MIRNILIGFVGIAISGCATVRLTGGAGEICNSETVADLGFVGQVKINGNTIKQAALLAAPPTDRLQSIDRNAVTKGLAKALEDLDSSRGATQGVAFIPWAKEYKGKVFPARAIDEAANARWQINRMWKLYLSTSSDFVLGRAEPASQDVKLGVFTQNDVEFASEMEKTLAAGGYDALTLAANGQLEELKVANSSDESLIYQQAQELNTARFISTYFRAYFRSGRLVQLSINTNDLTKRISDEITNSLQGDVQFDEAQKKKLVDAIRRHLQKTCREAKSSNDESCLLSPAFGDDSFVTRSGMSIQFAGISVALGNEGKLSPTLTYPDSTEFGPQLIRVVTEAIFDSHGLVVPAVSNSTACKEHLYLSNNCLSEGDAQTLLVGDTPKSKADRIKDVDNYAAQAESIVTAAASKIIRGASIIALNNEAVAKSVETLAGVSARKVVEKTLWNRYRDGSTCSSSSTNSITVWVSR